MKESLSLLEVVTEGDTSLARLPEPVGSGGWLRMRRANGRWFVTPPETDALVTAFSAATLEQTSRLMRETGESLQRSPSLEAFRDKLAALRKKYKINSAVAAGKPATDEPEDKQKPKDRGGIPPNHFRAEVRYLLDANLADAVVMELTIETPEPAKGTLMLRTKDGMGTGSGFKTVRGPGQPLASAKIRVLVDYLKGDKDRFNKDYLKFAFVMRSGDQGTASYDFKPAPAGGFTENLRLPLKKGVYKYTDAGGGVEVLAIGDYRLQLEVSKPD